MNGKDFLILDNSRLMKKSMVECRLYTKQKSFVFQFYDGSPSQASGNVLNI